MGRYGSTDAVFYLDKDFWPHNTSLFVTSFQGNATRWCYYLLRAISKADHSSKSAVPGVDCKDLFDIVVAVPPFEEQLKVVEGIDAQTQALNEGSSRIEREITYIQEYRTRLITDVVTGKLDVRAAAARLPDAAGVEPTDEAAEAEDLDEEVLDEADAEDVAA